MAESIRIEKASVVATIKKFSRNGVCTMRTLKRAFGLVPETEENRREVWRLSQTVAELLGGKKPEVNKDYVFADNGIKVDLYWA